jgi:chitinase
VTAVCTNTSPDTNCNDIYLGSGVKGTVVEMPEGCGPGRYAVAVSLEVAKHQKLPGHLERRGLTNAVVHEFTFDYNFGQFEKRADQNNVRVRIDYSDDPGYWGRVVDEPPSKLRKRQIEIDTHFEGDTKRWVEHTWHKEKRSMPLHELHKRWFSYDVKAWWTKDGSVDKSYTGKHHSVNVSTSHTSRCLEDIYLQMLAQCEMVFFQ